uniref:Transmembrane protein n=1 Tax=Heterorhabditis bacteriophora TaxID=37862 RepID=A0A1I7WET5_HETBA
MGFCADNEDIVSIALTVTSNILDNYEVNNAFDQCIYLISNLFNIIWQYIKYKIGLYIRYNILIMLISTFGIITFFFCSKLGDRSRSRSRSHSRERRSRSLSLECHDHEGIRNAWREVKSNPENFEAWMVLLNLVEQNVSIYKFL